MQLTPHFSPEEFSLPSPALDWASRALGLAADFHVHGLQHHSGGFHAGHAFE
jgi:hypothetical protein